MTPYYDHAGITIYHGDALTVTRSWPDVCVQCIVTSPPYWGLRDYRVDGQLGLEKSPEEYTAKMVEVFRECRRVLRDDGILWLNLGDSYAGGNRGRNGDGSLVAPCEIPDDLKPKDLVGIPWRVAFALQVDGWYLRSDIIWAKPNPTPESVTDRPTKSHEYIFLMSKNERYYYDYKAISEPFAEVSIQRMRQPGVGEWQKGGDKQNSELYPHRDGTGNGNKHWKIYSGLAEKEKRGELGLRNKRSVWTVPTSPYPDAHFATFPPKLIQPMVMAGSRPGDIVLDPFMGSGTVALVAKELNRQAWGVELNAAYIDMATRRLSQDVLAFDTQG